MQQFKKHLSRIIILALLFNCYNVYSWGFYAHKKINRHAVFALPPGMFGFFKNHIEYITEHAVDPDKRSFVSEEEAIRHYIDIDHYGPSPFDSMPKRWDKAVEKYTEEVLKEYGTNPWHIQIMLYRLTKAFEDKDFDAILYNAASLGHYVADATTPLHTTQYYDGKIPKHDGIHAFWETRIPELFANEYNFLVGRAEYIKNPLEKAWSLVKQSHMAIDTIFLIKDYMLSNFPEDKKFVFENRGQTLVKEYSIEYSRLFSNKLNHMVERKMRIAVQAVSSFWFTAWVNAGQPNLTGIEKQQISNQHDSLIQEQNKAFQSGSYKGRTGHGF